MAKRTQIRSLAWYKKYHEMKQRKKAEREQKKKEKALEKKRQLSLELRRKRLRRYRQKKSKRDQLEFWAEKERNNDKFGIYFIVLTENKKALKAPVRKKWRNSIMEIYDQMIKENRQQVSYHRKFDKVNGKLIPVHKELLVIEYNGSGKQETTRIRDKFGMFMEHTVVNRKGCTILNVNDWYEEEVFDVYTDTEKPITMIYSEILNQLVLNDLSALYSRNIFVYKSLLCIQINDKIYIIACVCESESKRLYDKIYEDCKGKKFILFSGELLSSNIPWLVQTLSEQTGIKNTRIKTLSRNRVDNRKPFDFTMYVKRIHRKYQCKHVGKEYLTYYFSINDNLMRVSNKRCRFEDIANVIKLRPDLPHNHIYSFVFETVEPTEEELNIDTTDKNYPFSEVNEYVFTIWQKGRNFTPTDYKKLRKEWKRMETTNIYIDRTKKTDFVVKKVTENLDK